MCVRSKPSESEDVGRVFSEKKPRWVARQEIGNSFIENATSTHSAEVKKPAHASRLSNAFLVLQKTTQPGHVIAMAVVLVFSALFYPTQADVSHGTRLRRFLSLLHLSTFAIQFGSQIWMTFVSGLSLYFTMPRHIFGQIQKVLFPLYFTLTGILSLISLYTYSQLHSIKDGEGKLQIHGMQTQDGAVGFAYCHSKVPSLHAVLCLFPACTYCYSHVQHILNGMYNFPSSSFGSAALFMIMALVES